MDMSEYIAFVDDASPLVRQFVLEYVASPWTVSEMLDDPRYTPYRESIIEEIRRIAPHFQLDV